VPRAGGGAHPAEGGYPFGVVALVRGDAAFEAKPGMEFLAEGVGEPSAIRAAQGWE